jgi:hypothetical protein
MLVGGLQRIFVGELGVGVVLVLAGAITAYLAVRRLAAAIKVPMGTDLGQPGGPAFDYIVWAFIGLPVFLVVGLLIVMLAGGGK